jgi:hypothetical protein
MTKEWCYQGLCFFKLTATEPRFFGFAEFLAALALMVLVWTVAEPRYRFRIRTAPLPLQGLTFIVVACVGFLTLMTDVWRAQEWYVPKGPPLTPAIWQGLLGVAFLLTFLVWAWFAFMRPATFSKVNAQRFEGAIAGAVLRGLATELGMLTDELADSVAALVLTAPDTASIKRHQEGTEKLARHQVSAHQIFLSFADPRFVKSLVDSAPRTALLLFREMTATRRYSPALATFARNFVAESIRNKDSYLYHEVEGYDTGLMGYEKPLTRAMFGNYQTANTLDRMLDMDFRFVHRWDADQLEAYCRLTLLTMEAYVNQGHVQQHSYVLHRACTTIIGTQTSLYKLNGTEGSNRDEEAIAKLRTCVDFVGKAVATLNSVAIPQGIPRRSGGKEYRSDPYCMLAEAAYDLIFEASAIREPFWTCWMIQHNMVWSAFFNGHELENPAGKLVKQLVRRKIFENIIEMERFPNYKGAKLIALTLNVLGHRVTRDSYGRDSRPLQRAMLGWVKRHYHWLHETRPEIAANCLVEGKTYDAQRRRIMFARPGPLGTNKTRYTYLQVN